MGHGKRKVKTLRKTDNLGGESSQDGAPADERPAGDGGDDGDDVFDFGD